MNKFAVGFLVLFTLYILTAIPSIVYAQDPTLISDDAVNQVAQDLYCPVCENVPLDVCPTQACAQWRELIREKLELGWSTAEIKAFFAEQYGDKVLSVPPRHGFNWVIYILPGAILLGGILLTINLVWKSKRNRRKTPPAHQPQQPAVNDTVMDEIEKDLKEGL